MAGSTSGDRRASSTNGRSKDSIAPVSEVEDERTLADRARTLADVDQTGSDSDQTLSDVDQTSADSDQASADRDQSAADRDQAASDQDLAAGGDLDEHDISRGIREHTANERERTAGQRAHSAQSRLQAGEQRDAIADDRDVAALARDKAAVTRDIAMAQAGVADAQEDGVDSIPATENVTRAAEQRSRNVRQRGRAAEQRVLAAEDRRLAEQDREQAGRERRRSLVDREMHVVELQRERELRAEALRHQHRAEQLARTLQRSLSPPRLPRIAGLEVAVLYEPSAPEEVGGDFYDLFPLTAGRSGVFLGDVCGKGPEAAAITSLARYTMRTAAMLHESPEAILMDLNAALLMHTDGPMQTCTAVYGQIDMSAGAAAVTLAAAGHPAPLVVRASGKVEATAVHGTMLGAFKTPTFQTCQVNLDLGDVIVVFSDGLLDTEIDGVRVDERRTAHVLSGIARLSARAVVDRLARELQRVDRPLRDDIAIMALARTWV